MTIAVTPSPLLPSIGLPVTFSAVGTGISQQCNAYEYELATRPAGSALTLGALVDTNGNAINAFVPDTAGSYGLKVYSFVRSLDGSSKFLREPSSFTLGVEVVTEGGGG